MHNEQSRKGHQMRPARLSLKQSFHALAFFSCLSISAPALPAESANDPIVVEAPPEGAVFHTGDTLKVRWRTNAEGIINVTIELSLDNGKTWFNITDGSIAETDDDWESYSWPLPSHYTYLDTTRAVTGAQCLVKVSNYKGDEEGVSAPFSIKESEAAIRFRDFKAPIGRLEVRGQACSLLGQRFVGARSNAQGVIVSGPGVAAILPTTRQAARDGQSRVR